MVVTDTDWEDFDDFDNFGISICTSGTRPTAHEGRHIYETDTNKTMVYTGAAWAELTGSGGVTDHGLLTGLSDDDHTQYLLVSGSREMTGNLDMGANNVYLDSGVLRISDGTGLSGSIGFTTGVQNFIQRQLYSGSDYTLLSDQDYMHTWAILGTEKMHLSTVDGLKLFTKINMNGQTLEKLIQMKGTSTHSAILDFRGDDAHEIKYNGTTDNDLEYLTFAEHNFKVGTSPGTTVLKIDSNEIAMTTGNRVTLNGVGGGTYTKDDASGNMELHVATGKTVKIVVG